MNPYDSLSMTRREVGVSHHIPVTHLVTETVVETKNAELISVIKLKGVPFQTAENSQLNYFHHIWHQFIASLDDNFGIYVTSHRTKVNHALPGNFRSQFLETLDHKYHQNFNKNGMYENTLYLALIFRGIQSGNMGKSTGIIKGVSQHFIKEAKHHFRLYGLTELKTAVDRSLTVLDEFQPELLGNTTNGHSELLTYFSLLINGNVVSAVPARLLNTQPQHKVGSLSKAQLLPRENLHYFLPEKRVFFGESIQLSGIAKSDTRYAAILSVKGYPEESYPLLLNHLMHLNVEWIATHSFLLASNEIALKKIQLQCKKLTNVNDAATSQIEKLQQLPDLIQSNQVRIGFHHHTLLLLSSCLDDLEDHLHLASKSYLSSGFSIMRESIGQEPAFWAQIPGNQRYIARASLITSENFADFCPLHNYEIGYRDQNHLGSAVTLLQTVSRTPYFFNFHRPGSQDQLTPGHTVIIGSNGAGKTVLLTFLDAQLSRYNGCSIFFDRNRGAEIYLRAIGGVYSILSPNSPETTCFNPLLLNDTPGNRQFCIQWLAQLCKHDADSVISPDAYEQITVCINYAFNHVDASARQLSCIITALPVNFEYWTVLRRWLRATDSTSDGEYAYLFDNAKDVLVAKQKVGFDMTHFLDNEPAQVRTALMMYLFHWVRLQMNGQLVALYLDEAWQYFDDEYWTLELKKSIPTFRKLNAFLVMATQSAASVANTSISHVILDNCSTQLFFPNPEAKKSHYCQSFNLTESEFSFVKNNEVSSRLFLIKQDGRSVICRLDLSGMTDEMNVLSSTEATNRQVEHLRQTYGADPDQWLPHFIKAASI